MKIKLSMTTWSRLRGLEFARPKNAQYEKVGDIHNAYHCGKRCTQIDGEWYSMEKVPDQDVLNQKEFKENIQKVASAVGVSTDHAGR